MTLSQMMNAHLLSGIISTAIMASLLAGCSSTLQQQRESQLAVLMQATDKSRTTLEEFHAGKLPPEHDVHLFLSYHIVNKGLQALDNYEFPLPNDQSITLTLRSIRISAMGALPIVTALASAHTEALSAEIELGVVLVPIEGNTTGTKFRMKVLSFVPRLSWSIFELAKMRFLESLLAVGVDKITEQLPLVELPVAEKIKLGGPASSYRQRIPTGRNSALDLDITVTETLHEGEFAISQYVFLENGLHVFGSVK